MIFSYIPLENNYANTDWTRDYSLSVLHMFNNHAHRKHW